MHNWLFFPLQLIKMSSQTRWEFAEILISFCSFKDFTTYHSLIMWGPGSPASVCCIWEKNKLLSSYHCTKEDRNPYLDLKEWYDNSFLCRTGSLSFPLPHPAPTSAGQMESEWGDIVYHAPWVLRDRNDKVRFSQMGRNKGLCSRDSGLATYRKMNSS